MGLSSISSSILNLNLMLPPLIWLCGLQRELRFSNKIPNFTRSERDLFSLKQMALKKLEVVHSTRIIGRKRINVPSKREKDSNMSSSPFSTPSPKRRGQRVQSDRVNRLESLPQDLLVITLSLVLSNSLTFVL